MRCPNCGTQLPQGANACPACGAASPSFHANVGSSPDGSTDRNFEASVQTVKSSVEVNAPSLPSIPQKPATYYGSQPHPYATEPDYYAANASHPYGDSYASSPYRTDTPPPPPGIKKHRNPIAFVLLICVVFLILLGVGVFLFIPKASTSGATTTSVQKKSTQQGQLTSPVEKQALYIQTISTTPVMNDSLSAPDNFGLDKYAGTGGNTRCAFNQGQLHSTAQPTYFSPCYAKATNYQNFVLQGKMTIISGHSGGLVFRADSTNDKGYQFRISTDGTYILNRIVLDSKGNITSDGETVASGSSAYILKGANQTNQLGVLAQGATISLFINGKYVDSATDATYHSGQVGIYVDSDASAVEGAFSNLQVWKLP